MQIFECDFEQFDVAYKQFTIAIGDATNTQDGIGNMYRGLVLHFLGLRCSSEQYCQAGDMLASAIHEGTMKGWTLKKPENIGV